MSKWLQFGPPQMPGEEHQINQEMWGQIVPALRPHGVLHCQTTAKPSEK